jgi:hypothetical protein
MSDGRYSGGGDGGNGRSGVISDGRFKVFSNGCVWPSNALTLPCTATSALPPSSCALLGTFEQFKSVFDVFILIHV